MGRQRGECGDDREDQGGIKLEFDVAKRRNCRGMKYKLRMNERLGEVYSDKIRRGARNRQEQVVFAQLPAGHCPKTDYYQQRIGKEESANCDRCGQVQSKDHWLECEEVSSMRLVCLRVNSLRSMTDEGGLGRFLRRAYPK